MNKFRMILLVAGMGLLPYSNTFSKVNLPQNDASTQALVELCKETSDIDAQNFCFGFGEGVYQAYLSNLDSKRKPSICFSSKTGTREAILQEFLTWNQTHPQFNQERAAKSLMRFFTERYRCQ